MSALMKEKDPTAAEADVSSSVYSAGGIGSSNPFFFIEVLPNGVLYLDGKDVEIENIWLDVINNRLRIRPINGEYQYSDS